MFNPILDKFDVDPLELKVAHTQMQSQRTQSTDNSGNITVNPELPLNGDTLQAVSGKDHRDIEAYL